MQNLHPISAKLERYLQQISQALLLAMMILPLAGLLVVAGDLLAKHDVLFAPALSDVGFEMIGALPILIAVSLAFSLSAGQAGMAALSGAAAIFVLNRSCRITVLQMSSL